MAINIQNIVAALEAKVAAATSTTETQELIVIIKSIKAAGQQTVVTYATESALPAASQDNVGNIVYVASLAKLQYSNGTAWASIGGGADLNAGAGISLTTEQDGSITITSQAQVGGDAVFDSALIGDVSIIGNEISAVDSYGASSELVLAGPMSVVNAVDTTVSGSIAYSNKNTVIDLGSENSIYFNANYSGSAEQAALAALVALPVGTTVIVPSIFNNNTYQTQDVKFTVTSPAIFYFNPYDPSQIVQVKFSVTNNSIATAAANSGNYSALDAGAYITYADNSSSAIQYTSGGSTSTTVLTAVGDSITMPNAVIAEATIDQAVVTTLVADSALIGDVTVVGNTISGTGPYGAGDQVVVDSDLLVTGDLIISNQIGNPTNTSSPVKYVQVSVQEPKTIINEFTLNSSMWASISGYGSGMNYVEIVTESYYGNYPETTAKLQNIKAGDIMFVSTQYGAFQFQISTIQPISGGFYISWLDNNSMMQVDNNSQITFTSTIITSEKKDYFLPLYQ